MGNNMLKSFDDTNLYYQKDLVEEPKAILVIVHGLAEHLGRYDYVTSRFVDAGISVYRFDHRGHGKSEGKSTYYENTDDIFLDVKTFVDLAKEENPNLPIFLLGHSMGGYAVTGYASKFPKEVTGVITSGAATRNNANLFTDIPTDLPEDTYLPNELSDGVCSDPQVIEDYINDPLVKTEISLRLVNTFVDGMKWLKENPDKFVDPVLLLHGYNDALVSEKDSREFFAEVPSEDKSLSIFAKLEHEILNEPMKDEIIDIIINWIEKRI